MFESLGQQLLAIRGEELRPGSNSKLLQMRAAAGASEKVPSDGGFLLQPEFVPDLVERMYQTGEILSRCTEIPISNPAANSIRFPQFSEDSRANGSRLGGVQVDWAEEATAAVEYRPKVMASEIVAHKAIAKITVTDELAADAGALETFTTKAFGEEMAFKVEAGIIGGSGIGQFLGLLNSAALLQVAKESGQAAGTVLGQNVVNMISRLWAQSRKRAVWICNQELLPQLYGLTLPADSGTAIVTSLYEFSDGTDRLPFDRLCGMSIIPVEYCLVPGQLGDLMLCDFSRYAIAMKEQMRTSVSIHVRFLTDESVFKFTMRVGGQPIDRLPVSPLNGTNTTSPFVALAPR